MYGHGAILGDHFGDSRMALAAQVRTSSINILELKGLVAGVQLAINCKAAHVWSESDSTTVVAWVSGRGCPPWTTLRDLRNLQILLTSLLQWRITHAYREGNKAADFLAAYQSPMGISIFPPTPLSEDLQLII
ncbi:hypothetical protein QJS04_geneDACA010893 [Acorus gramineus]|uniref:RNase H type-1 domain-containing protein n=1 Tax=Acorus gramineus TaxID=55184 RepID=A0AAV9BE05_ACOGR|nr:hypothetical protein QJS04_geneDACA010893 [Acorus gramineus]